jgi:hypothetical protein
MEYGKALGENYRECAATFGSLFRCFGTKKSSFFVVSKTLRSAMSPGEKNAFQALHEGAGAAASKRFPSRNNNAAAWSGNSESQQ